MGFSVEYSGVVVAQFFHHHVGLLLFMVRCLFYWVLRSLGVSDYLLDDELNEFPSSISSSSSSWVSVEAIRENLQVVTFASLGEISGCSVGGGGSSGGATTCAVCLNEFRGKDKVRELRNCCHIFHKKCLDRWLDLDQKTCPLCRTPFLLPSSSASGDCDKGETSWCVEHLLYLFGDDLLFPYSS